MTYNIDVFIRQLQSSIARRKYQLQMFESALHLYKSDYFTAREEYFSRRNTVVDKEFLENLRIDMGWWKKQLNKCQNKHKKLVEQQKMERKMLAYFINEKRYTSTTNIVGTSTVVISVPPSFLPVGNNIRGQEGAVGYISKDCEQY